MDIKKLNELRQTGDDPSRQISADGSVRPTVDTGFRVGMKASQFLNKKKDATRSWGADGT